MSASTPPRLAEDSTHHVPEELRIPLPPSIASSIDSGDAEAFVSEAGSPERAMQIDTRPEEEARPQVTTLESMEKQPPTEPEATPSPAETSQSGPDTGQQGDKREPPIPLPELLEIIRKDQYEIQRHRHLRNHVHRLLQDCGRTGRYLALHSQMYRRMVRCLQNNNKTAFASLYADSPLTPQNVNSNVPELVPSGPSSETGTPSDDQNSHSSWIHKLPSRSQESVIEFLSSVRNDSSFLANHIAKLSSFQLNNLARPHRQQPVMDSLLGPSPIFGKAGPRNSYRNSARSSDSTKTSEEMLRDPIFILLHCIFDSTSTLGSMEKFRQLDVWSSVCARIIDDGKPGSDDFCLSIVEAFATFSPWPMESELEMFLMELLNSGTFIIDPQPDAMVNFAEPLESQGIESSTAMSGYFDRALQTFLGLLVGTLPSSCGPRTAFDLIRATLGKVHDPERRIKAKNFFVSRWYCASFLSNAILYPESHAIMLNYHISPAARQKILGELAIRLQKVFSDALSPWSPNTLHPALLVPVRRLIELFDPISEQTLRTSAESLSPAGKHCLILGPHDLLSVATALYPEEATDSRTNSIFNRAVSGRSSITGSSTLTAGTNEPRTRTASSFAPSLCGTSFTSNSLSVDPTAAQLDRPDPGSSKSRPSTSGGLFGDSSKDPALLFLPDLWKLVTNRLDQNQEANAGTELDMFFVIEPESEISVIQPEISEPTNHYDSLEARNNVKRNEPADAIKGEDRAILIEGLLRASDGYDFFDGNLFDATSNGTLNLQNFFYQCTRESQANFDFQSGHFWWKCGHISASLTQQAISNFLLHLFETHRGSIRVSQSMIKHYQDWLFLVQKRKDLQGKAVQRCLHETKGLRSKMWFMSEVKHSLVYEEAMNITRALKEMVEPSRPKPMGIAARARQALWSPFVQDRAQVQILEALAAPKHNGWLNKLTDAQVEVTSRWLLHESIENFCRGEERIHRFCFEIQKCAKRLVGESLLESPVLWSSSLYEDERREFGIVSNQGPYNTERPSWRTDFSYPDLLHSFQPVPSTYSHSPFPTKKPHLKFSSDSKNTSSVQTIGLGLRTSAQDSSLNPLLHQQNRDSAPSGNWTLPPSPISPNKSRAPNGSTSPERRTFIENLRNTVISLLLSDLGSMLWTNGSETDRWMLDNSVVQTEASKPWLSGTLAADEFGVRGEDVMDLGKYTRHQMHESESNTAVMREPEPSQETKAAFEQDDGGELLVESTFPFEVAFEKLLQRFHLSSDPHLKLNALYEVVQLVTSHPQSVGSHPESGQALKAEDPFLGGLKSQKMFGIGVPRTRLTKLQEVAANCEERRLGSLGGGAPTGAPKPPFTNLFVPQRDDSSAFAAVRHIFSSPRYRQSTFFRDLQYIASFVPSSTLDHTPQGTAFWTVGLAAMSIKSATCRSMTSRAMQILAHHYESSNKKEPTRVGQALDKQKEAGPSLSTEDLSNTTLQDAARLYSTAALEGEPTAARELALFYLTHPELVPLVTMPMSKQSEVFRTTLGTGTERSGQHHRAPVGNDASPGLDPKVFAVAFHWMELAAGAGDADAITFLRENGDLRGDG